MDTTRGERTGPAEGRSRTYPLDRSRGANSVDYLRQAYRTLKLNGQLHILEAAERFRDRNSFVKIERLPRECAVPDVPVLRMLGIPLEELRRRAERLADQLRGLAGWITRIRSSRR